MAGGSQKSKEQVLFESEGRIGKDQKARGQRCNNATNGPGITSWELHY